jgi:CRP-like cAMP-binding protein
VGRVVCSTKAPGRGRLQQVSDESSTTILRNIRLFADCSEAQLKRLSGIVVEARYPDGALICEEKQPADCFYVLFDGLVEMWIDDRVRQRIRPGEIFGELGVLAGGLPRISSARAVVECHVGVVAPEDFEDLLIDMPILARQLLRSVSARLWHAVSFISMASDQGASDQ